MPAQGGFILQSNGPYDFRSSSAFYRKSRFEIDNRFGEDLFVRAFDFDGCPILIKIDCAQNKNQNSLKIEWFSSSARIDKSGLRRLLTKIFYLDFPLEEFYDLKLDPNMKKLTLKYTGFRPIMSPTIFEAAAWSIIGQQVNLAFAYTLKKRVIEKTNRKFVIDKLTYFLFPEPGDIARLNYSDLRAMQFSGRKAEYLIDFARLVDDGKLELERLGELEYEIALEKLLAIRGIGPWSANYILLRGAGHQDAFPIGDSGLNTAINRLYKTEGKPEKDYLAKLSEKWRPCRSLATYYLWKSLQEV